LYASSAEAVGVAVTANGRIVVAGQTPDVFPNHGVRLARLMPDGSNDPSFGSDGYAELFPAFDFYPRSLALQPDGRILVGGTDLTGLGRLVVVRFLADGSLDPSFGSGGIAGVDFAPARAGGGAMALQSDGRIVVAGGTGPEGTSDFAAARLEADGALDASFGSGGRAVLDVSPGVDVVQAVAVLADGRIVLGGRTDAPAGYALAMARLLSTGSPDTSFGTGGKVLLQVGESAECRALALQPDGKVVAVGSTYPQGPMLAVRLLLNGALDPAFASGGIDILGNLVPNAVLVDGRGGIDLAGQFGSFAFTRLLSNGSVDPDIGPPGFIPVFQQGQGHSSANAMALQPDGRIVLAGVTNEFISYMAVARFAAEPSTIPTLSSEGLLAMAILLAAVSLVALRGFRGSSH